MSELLERVVAVRIVEHLTEHNLHPPFQSAYRKYHSTETALIRVFDDLLNTIDEGDIALLSMLDLSAAFDTVDHSILVHRLRNEFGIGGVR